MGKKYSLEELIELRKKMKAAGYADPHVYLEAQRLKIKPKHQVYIPKPRKIREIKPIPFKSYKLPDTAFEELKKQNAEKIKEKGWKKGR